MSGGRRAHLALIAVTALALVSLLAVLVGPKVGLFSGSRPANLGYSQGRFLADGDRRPNWVSSAVPPAEAKHYVSPIAFGGDPARAWAALEAAVAAVPRARVVTRTPAYLHVEFASATLGFVDDAEFALDPGAGVIQARSGARLGIRDFGVNRERIEGLRKIMGRP